MIWQNTVQFFHRCEYRLDFDWAGSYWSLAAKCRLGHLHLVFVAYDSATVCVSQQLD